MGRKVEVTGDEGCDVKSFKAHKGDDRPYEVLMKVEARMALDCQIKRFAERREARCELTDGAGLQHENWLSIEIGCVGGVTYRCYARI